MFEALRRALIVVAFLGAAGCTSATTEVEGGQGVAGDTPLDATSGATTTPSGSAPVSAGSGPPFIGRADLTEQGNRVAVGLGALGQVGPIDISVDATPIWVLPHVDEDGVPRWLVELESGQLLVIDETGTGPFDAETVDRSSVSISVEFTDPLPDGRVVTSGDLAVALVGQTDRYPHGVLGDDIEASAVEVIDRSTGTSTSFGPDGQTVIEGLSPMLADVDDDGVPEVLVTQSNADVGAWLALWSIDGQLIAESEPIGQGNRWRNQLAVAEVGPDGELEIIDVRTPHLGRTVEYFRLDGSDLVRVATQGGFTSHVIGSRNLDLGIVADGDGDGTLDVIVPTGDRSQLGILRRTEDGVSVSALIDLPGRLTTNIGAQPSADGGLAFAVGTNDGVVRIWPAG